MSSQKTVTIIGGGIAGLSASVFLNEIGFKVTLVEASPKLGGRAYSFFDKEKNQFFDNGQHILAGWYKNTFEYLKLIGSYDKLHFQKNLEINFINTDREVYKLECPDLTPPRNLIMGLIKFKAFNLKDKFALKNIRKIISDPEKISGSFENTGRLLKSLNQTDNLIKYFWEPFILAVFNAVPEKVDTDIFLNVMKTGFGEKENSALVIPDVNLNDLLINDAVKYFEKNNVNYILNNKVVEILIDKTEKKVDCLKMENSNFLKSDFYISSVPFFAFKKVFNEKIYAENKFRADELKSSSIVSVHLFLKNEITEDILQDNSLGMTGLIDTAVQWIFIKDKKHLSLIISGADELQITEMSSEDIYKLCLRELGKTIKNFDNLEISGYKVIKEKRATFIPDILSKELRPKQETAYKNFFIAGDWTDTGLPATIESAVASAKYCTELLTNRLGGVGS